MSDNENGEEMVTKPFKFVTAGTDARFPNVNQTKHCWQNYVDYHKCIIAKGGTSLLAASFGSLTARSAPQDGTSAGTSNERRASSLSSLTLKHSHRQQMTLGDGVL